MNVTMRNVTIVAALTMGTMLFPAANKAAAGGIPLLGTVYDTDFVSAGVGGMRNTVAFHDITPTGVSGQVTQALLYWHGPTNSLDPTANALMLLLAPPNVQLIVGTNIGFSSDNCWGFDNSQAYVADVTQFVTSNGNGNGPYTLFPFSPVNTNGASLIVFFDDLDSTNNRDVVVFDGNDSNVDNPDDANGWAMTLSGINYTSGTANLQLHISDGQALIDDALIINTSTKKPVSDWVMGSSVPPGTASGLWDIIDINVTPDLGGAAPQTLAMSMTGTTCSNNIDGLSLVVAILDLPAGAAPDQPVDCVVGSGFWKTHLPVWPVNGLTLGTVTYTKTQLDDILKEPPAGGNCLHKLAKHLIAAKLNQAAGATVPQAVLDAIAAADALIGMLVVPPIVGGGSISPPCTAWDDLKNLLEEYNNGDFLGGPVSCDTVNNADFPSGPVSCNFAEGFVGPLFPCHDQNGDLNNDGVTDCFDLLLLLAAWGPNPDHPADCDDSENVGASDLLFLVVRWTGGPPPAGVRNCLNLSGDPEVVIACLEPDAAALRPPCCGGQ